MNQTPENWYKDWNLAHDIPDETLHYLHEKAVERVANTVNTLDLLDNKLIGSAAALTALLSVCVQVYGLKAAGWLLFLDITAMSGLVIAITLILKGLSPVEVANTGRMPDDTTESWAKLPLKSYKIGDMPILQDQIDQNREVAKNKSNQLSKALWLAFASLVMWSLAYLLS